MMELIDTHTHLFAEEFDQDREDVLKKAEEAGVSKMLLPNIDIHSIQALKQCVSVSKGACLPMMGLHPGSVQEDYKSQLDIIQAELFGSESYIGVGEIGLDLYWDQSGLKEQKIAFNEQCQWAVHLNLPVSMHTRSAISETMACLRSLPQMPKGVFHCFTGTHEEAQEVIDMGFYLGIGGVLTYKNSNLPDLLQSIAPAHLVLETDSPYLPPVPFRGKRNESAYLPLILNRLAEIYSMRIEDLAQQITGNTKKLFKI